MPGEPDHARAVEPWIERYVRGRPPERQMHLFCLAFNTLWRRARRTLGEVTLLAIGERVLFIAGERFAVLAGLKLCGDGIDCTRPYPEALAAPTTEREAAIRHTLVELLGVIGSLTAEILSPALHEELAGLTPPDNGTENPLQPPDGPGPEEGTP